MHAHRRATEVHAREGAGGQEPAAAERSRRRQDRRRLGPGDAASQHATVAQAQAAVNQSQASVNQNQVNLDHTTIEAPIDGIVIQRSVDVGQTVAASMQAPTLFIIAADLTKMQVNANIDEADVGRIRPDSTSRSRSTPTRPTRSTGTVSQIRLQPVVVQNVTTYGTVIDVPNAQLKLKPGMTANVKVEIAKRSDVLRVPNAALRFRPIDRRLRRAQSAGAARSARHGPRRTRRRRGGRGRQPERRRRPARRRLGGTRSVTVTAAAPASPGQSGRLNRARRRRGNRRGRAVERAIATPATAVGSGGGRGFDPARMMERFKGMSADEQKQFIARMKDRGQDTTAFEKETASARREGHAAKRERRAASGDTAQTIDALFAPLPTVEIARPRVAVHEPQLKPVNVRLGISDGTNTELLSGELQPNHGSRHRRHRSRLDARRRQPAPAAATR